MKKVLPFFERETCIYLVAMLASIIFSFIVAMQQDIVNPDAICYLGGAEAIGRIGLHDAMHLCPQAKWPFYSMVIYSFVKLTHFSYPTAGYIVDAVFAAFSVLFFIMIVKKLGGSKRVMWLAALVILFSHEFNSVREYIIRDHGFWVFYLLSIYLLLQFFTKPNGLIAVAWAASLLIAAMFRVEGFMLLIALPFLALLFWRYSFIQRVKFFIQLNSLVILILLAVGTWFLFHPQQTLNQLGRLPEIILQFKKGFMLIGQTYQSSKMALASHLLIYEKYKNAGSMLSVILCVWYFYNVVASLSLIYTVLFIYTLWQRAVKWNRYLVLVLCGYLFVNLAVTGIFLLENLFLSKRYLVGMCLVLMLFIPFGLDNLLNKAAKEYRYKLGLGIACLFMLLAAVGGIIHFGYSKAYINEAGKWINTNIPANATLYSNDYQLMYYSSFFGNNIFQKFSEFAKEDRYRDYKWKTFDYVAIRLNKHENPYTRLLMNEVSHEQMLAEFKNKRGDQVVIYKVNR